MSLGTALVMLLLLQVKHLAADYLIQSGYMFVHKGTYGHPGGILHAGLHSVLTVAVLGVLGVDAGVLVLIALIELALHYHIDWTKETVSNRWRLTPDVIGFWYVHGIDQALHQATYIAIVWWVSG